MIYKSTSVGNVIAKVIRDTRIQSADYIADLHEWIPEGMALMDTQSELQSRFEDVDIVFHKGLIPCGCKYIDAVEYNGRRLPYGNTIKNVMTGHHLSQSSPSLEDTYTTMVTPVPSPNGNYLWGTTATSDAEAVKKDCDAHPTQFYEIELDTIITSFSDGVVRVHYQGLLLDSNGLPLVPDQADYKEALYYFTRAKMVGAGFKDPVFGERELTDRFEKHAARAIAAITYPSPDQMEHRLNTLTRLLPLQNYWENFYRVDQGEAQYTHHATNKGIV